MNWIKNLFYKIFYRKSGNLVMGALTNIEAREAYAETLKNKDEITKANSQTIIDEIERNMKDSIRHGVFYAGAGYNKSNVTREQIKYILNYYREKGYKIKSGINFTNDRGNKYLNLTWKHWGK